MASLTHDTGAQLAQGHACSDAATCQEGVELIPSRERCAPGLTASAAATLR